jgi:hypothetical protein
MTLKISYEEIALSSNYFDIRTLHSPLAYYPILICKYHFSQLLLVF